MATRKIGASYILLPGHPLARGGHVLWRAGEEPVIVEGRGATREEEALEFHGGMIVAGFISDAVAGWQPGDSILERVTAAYALRQQPARDLLLLQGVDWETLAWTARGHITKLT